jgi:hypothetical protein
MLQIDDTIISLDLLDQNFVCDLNICKGICCIEGDDGAPLEENEVKIIEELLPVIWDDLSEKSKEVINKQGVSYIDQEGEPVTSIVNNAECVFTFFDENGICKCAIEKAFHEGKTNFNKPISCHLYPVRLQKSGELTALNYHRWSVCNCARQLGDKNNMPVFRFLKAPLIRRFGETWYEQLEIAYKELYENK